MIVRTISRSEVEAFSDLSPTPQKRVQRQLECWWESGRSCPEWCYIAEHRGKAVGRLVFETSNRENDIDVAWMDSVEECDDLQVEAALLSQSLEDMRSGGKLAVQYQITIVPTLEEDAKAKRLIEVIEPMGFVCGRERIEFSKPAGQPINPRSGRLAFRSVDDVGRSAYVAGLARVIEGSLDAGFQKQLQRSGGEQVAEQYIANCPKGQYQWSWFQLAYDSTDELVGLYHADGEAPQERSHRLHLLDRHCARALVHDSA